ncbi:hypothetical protein [Burkholderia sp. Ac-20353]|uniref:hypothetical protein n=1 Tax=Burkholderia sp. Ac-20353 TaxID=2703894 RepID=UPI00197B1039|nr:hypothetical protein [Burkholderia sp. Ac-20353]MBN3792086.1 hypothetical protein [Burkholderia sp. Ac-20353]
MKKLISLCASLPLVATLSGCGCWPLSTSERSEYEWHAQTLTAAFASSDHAVDACRTAVVEQCRADMQSGCNDRSHTAFKNVITGEPLTDAQIDRMCAPANRDSNCDSPSVNRGQIDACMKQKGFKLEEVTKKVCYVKFM